MITEEIMEAVGLMIDLCSDNCQREVLYAVYDMLSDFNEEVWFSMKSDEERREWLRIYLSNEEV